MNQFTNHTHAGFTQGCCSGRINVLSFFRRVYEAVDNGEWGEALTCLTYGVTVDSVSYQRLLVGIVMKRRGIEDSVST